jgi:hypothetical protein
LSGTISAQFAGIPASLLSAVHGKWLAITGTGSNSLSAAFAPFCNPNKLVSALAPQLTGLVKGKTIKISASLNGWSSMGVK